MKEMRPKVAQVGRAHGLSDTKKKCDVSFCKR